MASCTCALQVEVRTLTCSLHTFLTEKMCQSYPTVVGRGWVLPSLCRFALGDGGVEPSLSPMEQRLTVGRLGSTSRVDGSRFSDSCVNLFCFLITDKCFPLRECGLLLHFFSAISPAHTSHSFVSRHEEKKNVLNQTSSLPESQPPCPKP